MEAPKSEPPALKLWLLSNSPQPDDTQSCSSYGQSHRRTFAGLPWSLLPGLSGRPRGRLVQSGGEETRSDTKWPGSTS